MSQFNKGDPKAEARAGEYSHLNERGTLNRKKKVEQS